MSSNAIFGESLPPDTIRLLSIFPKPRYAPDALDTPLCGQFVPVSLNADPKDLPPYYAISYAWGPALLTQTIHINGHQLPITASADSILRVLRRRRPGALVWIDAVCIDQQNLSERRIQVAYMAQIFTQASRCIVWLGPAADDSDLALAFLRELRAVYRDTCPSDFDPPEMWFRRRRPPEPRGPVWEATEHLLNRCWFSRLWIMQEALLPPRAPVFWCGDGSVSWAALELGRCGLTKLQGGNRINLSDTEMQPSVDYNARAVKLRLLYMTMRKKVDVMQWSDNYWKGRVSNEYFASMCELKDFWMAAGKRLSIARLSYHYWHCQVSNDRDRIYGLLGLTGLSADKLTKGLEPNYDKSVQDVYWDATVYSLLVDRSFEVLSLAGIGYRNCQIPPRTYTATWIPDFSDVILPSFFGLWDEQPNFAAGGSHTRWATANVRIDGTKLHLTGICIGQVYDMTKALDPFRLLPDDHLGASGCKFWTWCQDLQNMIGRLNAASGSGVEQTLIAENAKSFSTSVQSAFVAFKDVMLSAKPPDNPISSTVEDFEKRLQDVHLGHRKRQALEYCRAVSKAAKYRSLALLQRFTKAKNFSPLPVPPGRRYKYNDYDLCLVPRGSEKNDLVWIFPGCKVPFVLRKSNRNNYTLIGECYVGGFMHGEALGCFEPEDISII